MDGTTLVSVTSLEVGVVQIASSQFVKKSNSRLPVLFRADPLSFAFTGTRKSGMEAGIHTAGKSLMDRRHGFALGRVGVGCRRMLA